MSRFYAHFMGAVCAGLLLVALPCAAPNLSAAESNSPQQGELAQRITDHVAAGEFAPALRLADQITDRAARDQSLKQIAMSQHDAGARQASRRTLARIDDDRVRSDSLDYILPQQLGTAGAGQSLIGNGLNPAGARGGAGNADFDAIIELVTTTIDPDTWDEIGGPGSIAPFEGGVRIDTRGLLRRIEIKTNDDELARLRREAERVGNYSQVRRTSKLRKVSLKRLEKEIQLLRATGREPTEAMRLLAGMTRVKYILVYPESGGLVIAGPAGDWRRDKEKRLVNAKSGRPVLRLDDLVVVLRHMTTTKNARFGCLITPRKKNLAKTQEFLTTTSQAPLSRGTSAAAARRVREKWTGEIQKIVGKQDIEVYGIDARTRVGRVLVEADYRMKLVGMGLEPGVAGVKSYLDLIQLREGKKPSSMSVLRWWFALNYDAIHVTKDRDAFELRGQGVQVLSENELLTRDGKRIHTGKSNALNRQFAASFTNEFSALAAKYPIYAELRNIFDLSLVAALCVKEDMPGRARWHASTFLDPKRYLVTLGRAPKEVDSVVNHRVIKQGSTLNIFAGVSGGVRVDTTDVVAREKMKTVGYGDLVATHEAGKPADKNAWWWD